MQSEETVVRPYELRAQTSRVLIQRLYREASSLVAEEFDLAKVEIRDRARTALAATRVLAFGAACVVVAIACIAACVVAALAYVLPVWLSALIVALAFSIIGFIAARLSQNSLAAVAAPLASTVGAVLQPPAGTASIAQRRSRIETARRGLDETLSALEHKTDLITPVRDTALGLGSLGIALSSIVRSDRKPRS
jgi:hypothetical protein